MRRGNLHSEVLPLTSSVLSILVQVLFTATVTVAVFFSKNQQVCCCRTVVDFCWVNGCISCLRQYVLRIRSHSSCAVVFVGLFITASQRVAARRHIPAASSLSATASCTVSIFPPDYISEKNCSALRLMCIKLIIIIALVITFFTY